MNDTNDKKNIAIRYVLIALIYNMITAIIGYTIDWLNDSFWGFDYKNWGLVEWWFVLSIIITIGGTMMYLAPFFERWLFVKLDSKIKKITKMIKNER